MPNKHIKISTINFVCLLIILMGLTFALGAYVGKLVSEKSTTAVLAGHLQCKLDNNKLKESLIESVNLETATLVKMHIAKTALAELTSQK